jgi:hypothetical protein
MDLVGVVGGPLLALLFIAVLCRTSVEAFARFGRVPNGVAWLVPIWMARAMARCFALSHIDSGDVFAGFAARQVIAIAGGVELDPRLFADRLWPLMFSPDDHDRSRAACREFGYHGAEITVEDIASSAETLAGLALKMRNRIFATPSSACHTSQGRHGSRNA